MRGTVGVYAALVSLQTDSSELWSRSYSPYNSGDCKLVKLVLAGGSGKECHGSNRPNFFDMPLHASKGL